MATININLDAGEEFREKLIQGLLESGMLLMNAAVMEMTSEHLIDTGIGRASITFAVDAKDLSCAVGSPLEYLIYLHEGTGIYARNGKGRKEVPWVYRTPDGKFHSTKGQKPHPFLEKAFNDNVENVKSVFTNIL